MSYLYVCEQGATIGISENRFQVKYKDGMVKSIPAETLEVIEVFGKVQITTPVSYTHLDSDKRNCGSGILIISGCHSQNGKT